jgi:hypothetical protein
MTTRQFLQGIGIVLILFTVPGCPGDGSAPTPTVTIGEVNCERASVTITARATSGQTSPPPGSMHSVDVTVTVKCRNTGVQGAVVSVDYWWGLSLQANTDASGDARFPTQSVSGAVPANPTVEVRVTPTRGDPFVRSVPVTIQ